MNFSVQRGSGNNSKKHADVKTKITGKDAHDHKDGNKGKDVIKRKEAAERKVFYKHRL
jgi:hypothetical protein